MMVCVIDVEVVIEHRLLASLHILTEADWRSWLSVPTKALDFSVTVLLTFFSPRLSASATHHQLSKSSWSLNKTSMVFPVYGFLCYLSCDNLFSETVLYISSILETSIAYNQPLNLRVREEDERFIKRQAFDFRVGEKGE